jgi:hypothetical protein
MMIWVGISVTVQVQETISQSQGYARMPTVWSVVYPCRYEGSIIHLAQFKVLAGLRDIILIVYVLVLWSS